MSQPTDMSYFLLRIHLAKISRAFVDQIGTTLKQTNNFTHILSIDAELEKFLHTFPRHFRLESYAQRSLELENPDGDIFVHAYLLNSVINTQRCKLYLPQLAAGKEKSLHRSWSREMCLKAARQILDAEAQLARSGHRFFHTRLRLAGILHGIFMAGIVFCMDACLNRPSLLQHEIANGELAESLRFIKDAAPSTLAAAKLYDSLMQMINGHQNEQQNFESHGHLQPRDKLTAKVPVESNDLNVHSRTISKPCRYDECALAPIMSDDCANRYNENDIEVLDGPAGSCSSAGQQTANFQNNSRITGDMQLWDDLFSDLETCSFF